MNHFADEFINETKEQLVCNRENIQRLARDDRGDLQAGQAAAASARRVGLPVGRVHALHQPDLAGRRGARRPLARQAQDGMRHPYDEDLVAQGRCAGANIEKLFR